MRFVVEVGFRHAAVVSVVPCRSLKVFTERLLDVIPTDD
jgi:hypothetical protein